MIDRIEELLESLAADDDEEEREGVLAQERGKAVSEGAWTVARASDGASGPRDQPESEEKRPGDLTALQRDNGAAKPRVVNRRSVATEKREAVVSGALRAERSESGEAPEGRTVFAELESLGHVANRRSVTAGEFTSEQPGLMTGELWKVGPVWAARGGGPGTALESEGRLRLAQAGLEGLYRQTVRGLQPAAPALPREQGGRTVRAQEPGSAASLAVDELDRAVRRDSRRYDGGMSIY